MLVLSFGKKFPQALNRIQRCNVLVIGNTGIGKSTLISTLFDVSISNTVTQKISDKPYTKKGSSIAAYDTPGLEKDKKQRDKVKHDIAKFIRQQNQKEPSDQIHAAWYCVNSQVTRETEIDSQWIGSIAKELPVLAVITRANGSEGEWLPSHLESIPGIQQVVRILAKTEKLRTNPIEPYGMDNLLSATEDLLEQIARKAIVNAVNAKASHAFGWCRDGCAKVLVAQLAPVPFVKLATSPFQTQLLVNISREFGYQFNSKELSELCALGLGVGAAGGIDVFLEQLLRNLPGIDYNNIQNLSRQFTGRATQ